MQAEAQTMARGRFAFGRNWAAYLQHLTPERITAARESLQRLLNTDRLDGKRFLDAGSVSGLFSLAAASLGARVHSFDYDVDSVRCTEELRRHYGEGADWKVEQGSVLDRAYMSSLGTFDVIYSWGVLHHTGNLAGAMENVLIPLAPDGVLSLALYNDQGWISRYWLAVKKLYTRVPPLRPLIVCFHAPYLIGLRWVVRRIRGGRQNDRGMSPYYDLIDWLGGYPFEVSRPEQVVAFYEKRGLSSRIVKTCGRRLGCNEFVFSRQ